MTATVSVDKFSFPSGHATRAVAAAAFFTALYPVHWLLNPAWYAWALAVVGSRVLLGRHHVLDVTCGAVIGLAEAALVAMLCVDEETAKGIYEAFAGEDPWSSG